VTRPGIVYAGFRRWAERLPDSDGGGWLMHCVREETPPPLYPSEAAAFADLDNPTSGTPDESSKNR
jgi:hypothetical protein